MAAVAPAELEAAYRTCCEIARREAKNFYYAFRALPKDKHNAICAVYAFMRKADDLSDDESQPRAERRAKLAEWMRGWREAAAGDPTTDPVFVALADARVRFHIGLELLEQLVQGTAMDLDPARDKATGEELDTYQSFDELYRYCYLVASVVGLVCICIFGYKDTRAEQLAEELGIAFQLTNILRDVREDAERNRVYLPLDDLAAYQLTPADLVGLKSTPPAQVRELLAREAGRAAEFYRSADGLLPLIDADSRPALQVLVRIYHRLLERIAKADYDVFSSRISVPSMEKLTILAGGMLAVYKARLLGRG